MLDAGDAPASAPLSRREERRRRALAKLSARTKEKERCAEAEEALRAAAEDIAEARRHHRPAPSAPVG